MTCNKCNTKCLSQSVVTAIAADEALSWPISMQNFTAGTLHMPDAWTAATIGFQVSDSLHGTYQPLLDGNGNRIEIAVTAGNSYPIPYDVMNATFVKLWSQSAGTDVNQAEERRLVLDLTTCAAEVVEGGAGGSVAWGEITGTLSNQTDLQNALDELNTYDVQLGFNGVPADGDKDYVVLGRACRLLRTNPSSAVSGYAHAEVAPDATSTFTLTKNADATVLEEVEWTVAGGVAGAFSGDIAATAVDFAAGDRLYLNGPATADTSLADIRVLVRLELI